MNISYSNLKIFAKSPSLFYKTYIEKSYAPEVSEACYKGKMFEDLLLYGEEEFFKKYRIVERRKDKDKELSQSVFDEISGMCASLKSKSVWQELKTFKSQKRIEIPFTSPLFKKIVGIPDFFKKIGSKIIIVDTKTVSNGLANKHKWAMYDFDWYMQMAMYRLLLQNKYPNVSEFEFYHLCIENSEPIYPIYLYKLPIDEVNKAKEKMLELIAKLTTMTKPEHFADPDISFEKATELFNF